MRRLALGLRVLLVAFFLGPLAVIEGGGVRGGLEQLDQRGAGRGQPDHPHHRAPPGRPT